jgi:hypothetical protein
MRILLKKLDEVKIKFNIKFLLAVTSFSKQENYATIDGCHHAQVLLGSAAVFAEAIIIQRGYFSFSVVHTAWFCAGGLPETKLESESESDSESEFFRFISIFFDFSDFSFFASAHVFHLAL